MGGLAGFSRGFTCGAGSRGKIILRNIEGLRIGKIIIERGVGLGHRKHHRSRGPIVSIHGNAVGFSRDGFKLDGALPGAIRIVIRSHLCERVNAASAVDGQQSIERAAGGGNPHRPTLRGCPCPPQRFDCGISVVPGLTEFSGRACRVRRAAGGASTKGGGVREIVIRWLGLGAECQIQSNRSASPASTIDRNKIGRASRGVEAHFACIRSAALVIRSNRSEVGNTGSCIDSQHGIERAADRIHGAQAIGRSGPFPPNRFRGCLPGMSRLTRLSGGVVVRTDCRGRDASERLGIGKSIVGNCRPRRLHDGE